MSERLKDQPILNLSSVSQWTHWLIENHETQRLVWLRIRKSASKKPGLILSEAVKEAIRFGWIDGQVITSDEDYFYLRFTPRGPKSVWSLINRNRAQAFIDEGTMTPLGLKTVENGKINATWQSAYTSFKNTEIPQDLLSALQSEPLCSASFDQWSHSDQLQAIFWITRAKTQATRQDRIKRILALLKSNGTLKDLSKKR